MSIHAITSKGFNSWDLALQVLASAACRLKNSGGGRSWVVAGLVLSQKTS